ncbi:nitroreductase family protein [Nanoarchaeota archaeon]
MDVIECIKTRRTIHKYTKQPVEFDKLMACIEAGMNAPSSGNIQNWMFVVTLDKKKIHTSLCDACLGQECLTSAQAVIILCADEDMAERHYGLRGKRLYSIQNCAANIQNMLLCAHALGLGAAWIGAFDEDHVKRLFAMPECARPQAVLTFGYPAEKPPPKRMRHIDDLTRWESYSMRYKDAHRSLRDFSVEWEKQIEEAKYRFADPVENIKKKAKKIFGKKEPPEDEKKDTNLYGG